MRVFVTGATGFIGTALTAELLGHGHQVIGLTRSDAGEQALRAAGAEIHRGSLEHPESLAAGAAQADAVIHAAFDHDFANFLANCEKDTRAIQAIGGALAGTARPLLVTSGVGVGSAEPGQTATEDVLNKNSPIPRVSSEIAAEALVARGVNVGIVRLPQVHDTRKQGMITPAIELAREKGVSAYIGDGTNRWSAAHLSDVVRLYRLALEAGVAGARYHAVAEEGVSVREVAEVVAQGLRIPARSLTPAEVAGHFGWFAMFAGLDLPASSAETRQRLSWQPTGPGLLSDLRNMDYAA